MEKPELRQNMRWLLARFGDNEQAAASEAIVRHIHSSPIWQQSSFILLYAPLPEEPDISPLFQMALAAGKRVFYPKISGSDIHVHEVTEPGQFKTGAFGVNEPDETKCRRAALSEPDLAIVPGLAFDLRGGRLGRGRGYYDRFLMGFSGRAAGCFFNIQKVDAVPLEAQDQLLRLLVTEDGWHVVPTG